MTYLLLTACLCVTPDSATDSPVESPTESANRCTELIQQFQDEATKIQSCTSDAECGQPLSGTSCGCTRNWVARKDADTTDFYAAISAAQGCDLGLTSSCDCPKTYGFACVDHRCAWDYAPGAVLPSCHADRGDPYDLNSASIAGNTLTVNVSSGGGCEQHEWVLCWPEGSFLESDPVQARLEIWQDNKDDPCDAWITEEVPFDLMPLQDAWHQSYGSGSGTMLIQVGTAWLNYSF